MIRSGDLGVSVGGIDIEIDDVDEIYHDEDDYEAYNHPLRISALVNHYGIALSRLTPRGFGEDIPVYSNKTSFGKSVNRRVAVAINL
jgi:hypothetical protein